MISFGFTQIPLTWRELITRTLKEFIPDNGLGLAAQLAYYFFSLFPALLMYRAGELLPARALPGPNREHAQRRGAG